MAHIDNSGMFEQLEAAANATNDNRNPNHSLLDLEDEKKEVTNFLKELANKGFYADYE